MEKYTIYCTEEQARKALALGAPINIFVHAEGEDKGSYKPIDEYTDAIIPTAEQMIGWLEEQGLCFDFLAFYKMYSNRIRDMNNDLNTISFGDGYKTRQEDTLAAIDAALEYLTNNKK